ncbi:hypothetical protein NVP1121O_221 [Vibrio phage 1.121.O._10N.286.46.C4]|nr:hypothetical protein NVP1121O_221 [Vibrio phage 1.121.O._10N.286.46.C4]
MTCSQTDNKPSWKEEHGDKRPEDYESPYEYRRYHQWKAYPMEDEELTGTKVISYFKPPSAYKKELRDLCKGVTGEVYERVETTYTKVKSVKEVIDLIQDLLYTKKLTKLKNGKKVRRTFREGYPEALGENKYAWMDLMHYARQELLAGSETMILTNQEWFLIKPKLTKKEERKKRVIQSTVGY